MIHTAGLSPYCRHQSSTGPVVMLTLPPPAHTRQAHEVAAPTPWLAQRGDIACGHTNWGGRQTGRECNPRPVRPDGCLLAHNPRHPRTCVGCQGVTPRLAELHHLPAGHGCDGIVPVLERVDRHQQVGSAWLMQGEAVQEALRPAACSCTSTSSGWGDRQGWGVGVGQDLKPRGHSMSEE